MGTRRRVLAALPGIVYVTLGIWSAAHANGWSTASAFLGWVLLVLSVIGIAAASALEALAYRSGAKLGYLPAAGTTFAANLSACAVFYGALWLAREAMGPGFTWTLVAGALAVAAKVAVIMVTNRRVADRRALFVPALTINLLIYSVLLAVGFLYLMAWLAHMSRN